MAILDNIRMVTPHPSNILILLSDTHTIVLPVNELRLKVWLSANDAVEKSHEICLCCLSPIYHGSVDP